MTISYMPHEEMKHYSHLNTIESSSTAWLNNLPRRSQEVWECKKNFLLQTVLSTYEVLCIFTILLKQACVN